MQIYPAPCNESLFLVSVIVLFKILVSYILQFTFNLFGVKDAVEMIVLMSHGTGKKTLCIKLLLFHVIGLYVYLKRTCYNALLAGY